MTGRMRHEYALFLSTDVTAAVRAEQTKKSHRYTRPVSTVSTTANGIAATTIRIANAVSIVSRRIATPLALQNAAFCPRCVSYPRSSLPGGATRLNERGLPANLQGPLGVQKAVKLDELGHESGPAGLVAGAQPGTIIAVEIFIKENVIAPVGIALEFLGAS
jgi:hypothetical protein